MAAQEPDAESVASAVQLSIGLVVRRMRQLPNDGGLTLPEGSALARLERAGASTSGALAKLEQISPQSMGATLAALEARGLVERQADQADGRRVVLSLTEAGSCALRTRRSARIDALAQALTADFSSAERKVLLAAAPLLERLADRL